MTFFCGPRLVKSTMTLKLGLVAPLLLIAGCGTPALISAGATSPRASASAPGAATAIGGTHQVGITAVAVASAVAPDGSAEGARDTFESGKDRTIIAVVTLANLPGGTRISYVRSIDGKFVNTKSAILRATSKYFYFEFKALPGQSFTRGHYRLRLYVDDHAASEITYQVV